MEHYSVGNEASRSSGSRPCDSSSYLIIPASLAGLAGVLFWYCRLHETYLRNRFAAILRALLPLDVGHWRQLLDFGAGRPCESSLCLWRL